jgi:hypothetical protein
MSFTHSCNYRVLIVVGRYSRRAFGATRRAPHNEPQEFGLSLRDTLTHSKETIITFFLQGGFDIGGIHTQVPAAIRGQKSEVMGHVGATRG